MENPTETLARLPHLPGIYIYKDAAKSVLYVGKAKDLKRRVTQYFQTDTAVGAKTTLLVSQIDSIHTITTNSEFDALLLESKLIRTYLPKYNVIARDDKSPLYVCITTDEELPRILWIRKNSLVAQKRYKIFGPFQSGRTARSVLRQIRKIIPYCTQVSRNGRPCFYTHIGQCEPCPSVITPLDPDESRTKLVKAYRKNIHAIVAILSGKSLTLLHDLERQMQKQAQLNHFEEAQKLKLQVSGIRMLLNHHYDPHVYMQNESFAQDVRAQEEIDLRMALAPYYPNISKIEKIECIDISNTQGSFATGSLVVMEYGIPDKQHYRRFKIRTQNSPNDFVMIAEVLRRRLLHKEWRYPDLLVIDGGKGQVSSAIEILDELSIHIPIVGLAKRFEEIIVPTSSGWHVLRLEPSHKGLLLLERIRDESHRFALGYHRKLRKKGTLALV